MKSMLDEKQDFHFIRISFVLIFFCIVAIFHLVSTQSNTKYCLYPFLNAPVIEGDTDSSEQRKCSKQQDLCIKAISACDWPPNLCPMERIESSFCLGIFWCLETNANILVTFRDSLLHR